MSIRHHLTRLAVLALIWATIQGAPAIRADGDEGARRSGTTGADSESDDALVQHLRLLDSHGVAADTESVLDFLSRQRPSAAQQRQIERLIEQLSSDEYRERESATRQLRDLGLIARPSLVEAAGSADLETVRRAEKILQALDAGDAQWRRDSLVLAALQVLRSRKGANAVPVLLHALPVLTDVHLRDVACEAVWACTDESHAMLLRRALADDDQHVRAAAIVALELALGDRAVATVVPYLKNESALSRLAAARALADRRPRESITVLVALVADADDGVAWQADALLQKITDQRMDLHGELKLAQAWRRWAARELPTAQFKLPIGRKRLDLIAGRDALYETFSREKKSLADGYGIFRYEADNAGKASVVDGQLLIDGDNNEGDQRLYITSDRMIGRATWPRNMQVRARLGGKDGNNFGWHVGVSVGRVKVLFHPGLGGGELRAETTDTHQSIFANVDMGFTPAPDAVHEMLVKVRRSDAAAEFEITVRDANSESKFNRRFTVSSEQLGKYNRVGLERSGRTGAAAIFDAVSIQLHR